MLNREEEKEKLFQEATNQSLFDVNDLCIYAMSNNLNHELLEELIEELVQEGKLSKFHYSSYKDEYYVFDELVRGDTCIVVYRRNLMYGEQPISQDEFIDLLLTIPSK